MAGLNYGNKYTLASNLSQLVGRAGNRKAVYVFDSQENFICKYEKIEDAEREEKICVSSIRLFIRKRKLHNNRYYSYKNPLPPNTNLF